MCKLNVLHTLYIFIIILSPLVEEEYIITIMPPLHVGHVDDYHFTSLLSFNVTFVSTQGSIYVPVSLKKSQAKF